MNFETPVSAPPRRRARFPHIGGVVFGWLIIMLIGQIAGAGESIRVQNYGYHTEYELPDPARKPWSLAVDSGGRVWVTAVATSSIGFIDPNLNTWTEYPLPAGTRPFLMTAGPDGRMWLTDYDWTPQPGPGHLLAIDPATGAAEVFRLPTDNTGPADLLFDSEGFLWYSQFNASAVVRRAPNGAPEPYEIAPIDAKGIPPGLFGLTFDAKGRLWIAEAYHQMIARLDPSTRKVTHYNLPPGFWGPTVLATDTSGQIWAGSHGGNRLLAINPDSGAVIREFYTFRPPPGEGPVSRPTDLIENAAGEIWFAEHEGNRIGRIIPSEGTVVEYNLAPRTQSLPQWLARDADDAIWYAAYGTNVIGNFAHDSPYTRVEADRKGLILTRGGTYRGKLILTAVGEQRSVQLKADAPRGTQVVFENPSMHLKPGIPTTVGYTVTAGTQVPAAAAALVLGVDAGDYVASTTVHFAIGNLLAVVVHMPRARLVVGAGLLAALIFAARLSLSRIPKRR